MRLKETHDSGADGIRTCLSHIITLLKTLLVLNNFRRRKATIKSRVGKLQNDGYLFPFYRFWMK